MECLIKITSETAAEGIPIFLVNYRRVVIGRAVDNAISIDSINVSRSHAVLQKCENQWQIKDSKSINGVYINQNQITVDKFYKIMKGDVISIGPPTTSDFQFLLSSHDSLSLPFKYFKVPCYISIDGLISSTKVQNFKEYQLRQQGEKFETLNKKAKVLKLYQSEQVDKTEEKLMQDKFSFAERFSENLKLIERDNSNPESMEKVKNFEHTLSEFTIQMEKLAKENKELIKENKFLKENLKEVSGKQSLLVQEIESLNKKNLEIELNMQDFKSQIFQKNDRLLQEKMEISMRHKQELADVMNAQLTMQKEFESAHQSILNEKIKIEEVYLKQFEDLEKKLDFKENQTDMLRSELYAINMTNDQALFDAHQQISEIMDVELVCSICSELFINAVTLGCTHSFCEDCIKSWGRGEERGCPICRTVIHSQIRCVVVDNFIDNMVMNFGPDERKLREDTKRIRLEKAAVSVP